MMVKDLTNPISTLQQLLGGYTALAGETLKLLLGVHFPGCTTGDDYADT